MSLAIRLARGGMKKKPYYRIVVTDSRNARDGKFLEKIGTYNPLLNKENPERIKLDGERAAHWLSVGAQPSDRVARFLDAAGLRTRAARSNPTKGLPGDKAKERAEVAATKQAELDAATADAAEKAKAAAAEAAAAPAEVEAPSDTAVAETSAEAAPEIADVPAETADAAPADTTDAPADTSNAPAETVDAPAETVDAPAETADAPALDAATETDASPAGPAV